MICYINSKKIVYFFLISLALSCSDNAEKNEITIVNYSFEFPSGFKLIKEKGIDSYVGRIKGNSIEFNFDYGYYTNELVESKQEFLNKRFWLLFAADRFMKEGITYDANNYPKVEVISIRSAKPNDSVTFKNADFVASCKHDSILFDYPIVLPNEVKEHIVKIDTVQNNLRKIVIAKNPMRGITGLYLKDLSAFNKSVNNYAALAISTSNLTKQQQDTVLKIFSTVKFISSH